MELNQSLISKALSVAYEKAIDGFEFKGFKVLDSAYDLAKDYADESKSANKMRHLL